MEKLSQNSENGNNLDISDDILEYTDKVAIGEDFGKTPSTAKYQNLGEYFHDGSEEEQKIKGHLWDMYRVAPAPENLQKYVKAGDLYQQYKNTDEESERISMKQVVDEAVNAGVALELSTIVGNFVYGDLAFSRLGREEVGQVERGLYDGDPLAQIAMKAAKSGSMFGKEDDIRRANFILENVELRKKLFERVKGNKTSGYDSLSEVPFAGSH